MPIEKTFRSYFGRPLAVGLLAVVALIQLPAAACDGYGQPDVTGAPRIPDLRPTVILISFDGFRWDYFDRTDTPHFDRVMAGGVKAEGLIPIFPTLTFSTHYSMVTGLYAENHGVVGNSMYDPEFDAAFRMGDRDAVSDGRWYGGEPIWVTAEKQGQTAATFFWPGSEAEIAGVRPSEWREYDGRVPNEDRVDTVLAWLDRPQEQRPTLITLYFSEVDSRGHRYGPDAPETMEAVRSVDAVLGHLLDGLETRGVHDEVNLVLVSDHGMMNRDPERLIFLDDYIDIETLEIRSWGVMAHIWTEEEQEAGVLAALRDAHPNMQAYRRHEIPGELRFRNHRRIPPVLAIPDPGWLITSREHYARNPDYATGATHGWLPSAREMWGILVLHGPAFQSGLRVDPVESIHLYELMAHVLGLDPAENDGDLGAVRHLLSEPAEVHDASNYRHRSRGNGRVDRPESAPAEPPRDPR